MSNVKDFPATPSRTTPSRSATSPSGEPGMGASDVEYVGFIMKDDRSYTLDNPADIVQIVAFMRQRGIKVRREE